MYNLGTLLIHSKLGTVQCWAYPGNPISGLQLFATARNIAQTLSERKYYSCSAPIIQTIEYLPKIRYNPAFNPEVASIKSLWSWHNVGPGELLQGYNAE